MTLTRPSGTPRVLPLRSAAQMVVDCSRRRIGSGAGATAAPTATSRPAHSARSATIAAGGRHPGRDSGGGAGWATASSGRRPAAKVGRAAAKVCDEHRKHSVSGLLR